MDIKLLDPSLGTPIAFPTLLASTTGVTTTAIELAGSTADYYTIVDSIYFSCDSIPTKGDFTLNFVGYDKTFAVEYDELGVAGFVPLWSWMDFLNPDPAANTVAWWLNKSIAGFVMAPTGDSISIDGRNAGAADNYVGTNAIALTINIHGRLIDQDVFH